MLVEGQAATKVKDAGGRTVAFRKELPVDLYEGLLSLFASNGIII